MSLQLKLIRKCVVSKIWLNWLNDKEVTKYSENRLRKHSKISQKEFLKEKLKNKRSLIFKIFFKKEHIGIVELSNVNHFHKHCEVTYMIGRKEYWNRGIGTRLISKISNFAFNKLSMKKIYAGTYENNFGSMKILKNNGYKVEGRIKNFFKFSHSKRVAKVIFGVTKREFVSHE